MTTSTLGLSRRGRPLGSSSTRVRVLVLVAGLSTVALMVTVVGLVSDDRVITGAPAWLKPAKFAVSIAVYCATLAWLLTLVQGHPRLVRLVAWVTALALALELVLILAQVVRGTTSHFNTATPLDARIFDAMGGLVALVFLGAVVTGVLLARQRGLPAVLGSGIRGGVAVAVLGMAAAILMLVNRQYGDGGAHTVGAPDGGPGLPLTGWSTEHGDLRVPHFVGLHALQALPLLALLLQRYATRLTEGAQVRLVRLTAVAAAGLVVLLAVEAERGLPLLAPDATVVTAGLVGLAVLGGLGALVVVRDVRGQRGLRS
ncbi:hypothetical protein [uncultured Friedmanniella sp.]|uniref:hypothetical protein n=1 Tax=uncultured Friedmanniella sp. TaxID=335381 RepID=UPI0035C9FBBC